MNPIRSVGMGTGTGDMIRRCREAGLAEPAFSVSDGFTTTLWRKVVASTPEVTPEVTRVVEVMRGEMKRVAIQEALGLSDGDSFRKVYLLPALEAGLVEMTIPDKPRSSKQRYRLTAFGRALRETFAKQSG